MIFLVDNGSMRPNAYLNLCRIAEGISQSIGLEVRPAPLLHANKISKEVLSGHQPKLVEEQISDAIDHGLRTFTVMPLFFGPSGALVDYLPRRLKLLREKCQDLEVTVLNPLFKSPVDGGDILSDILQERVLETVRAHDLTNCKVVLLDHGSPKKEVTEVRNVLAELLNEKLKSEGIPVSPASMERRKGEAYDFNEPLLEKILFQDPFRMGPTIVSQLFLSPGRHAGPGGDIATICRKAEAGNPGLRTYRSELIGNHPKLIELLNRRWNERDKIKPLTF